MATTVAPDEVVAATSLFLSGDIVLQNPKETGVIFGMVVILSILLENVFGAFRENRSKYVKAIFTQVSEEMMIVGTIGLLFVFVVQSVDDLPQRWVLLFRWTTTVLFFMMVLFVLGIVYVAVATTLVINRMKKFEQQVVAQGITLSDNLQMSRLQRAFMTFRALYLRQVKYLSEKHSHGSIEAQMIRIPFSKYLEARMRSTMNRFTDVTWQCWLSLLFASCANSIRLFLLPGNLQEKNHQQFTESDRVRNHVSFIIIIGWIPFLIYLIGVILLLRSNNRYMASVLKAHKQGRTRGRANSLGASFLQNQAPVGEKEGGGAGGPTGPIEMTPGKTTDAEKEEARAKVWLPPKQLAGELVGELCEDPSTYLLRGNRAFTLHMLKIPTIMTEFYLAIFIVGMWGEMSRNLGVSQVGLVPMSIIPFFGTFALLPISLLVVTLLCSLGCRLDEKELKRLVLRSETKKSKRGGNDGDGPDDNNPDNAHFEEEDMELQKRKLEQKLEKKQSKSNGLLNVPGIEDGGRSELSSDAYGSFLGSPNNNNNSNANFLGGGGEHEKLMVELQQLRARVKFLEDLCVQYGIPIGERTSDASEVDPNMTQVYQAISKLQEETKKVQDQQAQLSAMHRAQRIASGGAPVPASYLTNGAGGGDYMSPRGGGLPTNHSQANNHHHQQQQQQRPESQSTLEAISAARQFSARNNFSVNSVQRPAAHSGQLNNIHKNIGLL